MNNLSNLVTSSVLTRLLANIFIFIVLLVALAVAAWQLLTGQQIAPVLSAIIGAGIGYALHVLGITVGAATASAPPAASKPE